MWKGKNELLSFHYTGVLISLNPTRKETAHRALATQKKLAYLGFQCLD
jgi:hypothetical protein